jgi:hypothetical protein
MIKEFRGLIKDTLSKENFKQTKGIKKLLKIKDSTSNEISFDELLPESESSEVITQSISTKEQVEPNPTIVTVPHIKEFFIYGIVEITAEPFGDMEIEIIDKKSNSYSVVTYLLSSSGDFTAGKIIDLTAWRGYYAKIKYFERVVE